MIRIRFLLPMALCAVACSGPRSTDDPDARLNEVVAGQVSAGFSGVVLVARGGEVLLSDGYGSMGEIPLQAHDRFWISSVGKQFVGAAILRLAEEGGLRLNDRLDDYFEEVPADKAGITIRQLLTHTSGIGQSYVSEGQSTRDAAVRAMLSEPLEGTPGQGFRYSNSNFQLATAIVEVVSGRSYQDYARSVLWRPAGMTNTGFAGDSGSSRVSPTMDGLPPRLAVSSWGGEGVYSSAPDLFRWYRALRSGRMLEPRSLELLLTPVAGAEISEGASALGWYVGRSPRGTLRTFTRGNDDFGANSLIYAYPEQQLVIIVMTHGGDSADTSWSRTILGKLEDALGL